MEEGLEEPVAEEASAAGDEEVGVAEGEERVAGEREDVGEVLVGKWLVCHVVSMPCERESCCGCEPRKAEFVVAAGTPSPRTKVRKIFKRKEIALYLGYFDGDI